MGADGQVGSGGNSRLEGRGEEQTALAKAQSWVNPLSQITEASGTKPGVQPPTRTLGITESVNQPAGNGIDSAICGCGPSTPLPRYSSPPATPEPSGHG